MSAETHETTNEGTVVVVGQSQSRLQATQPQPFSFNIKLVSYINVKTMNIAAVVVYTTLLRSRESFALVLYPDCPFSSGLDFPEHCRTKSREQWLLKLHNNQ